MFPTGSLAVVVSKEALGATDAMGQSCTRRILYTKESFLDE